MDYNEDSEIKCPSCGTTFTQRKNLYSHVRKFHDEELLSDLLPAKNCFCQFCDKKFLNQKSLNAHIAKYHPSSEEPDKLKTTRIICPYEICKKELFTFPNLRGHLFEKHDVKVESEIIEFCGIAEFESWKLSEEQATFSKFVADRAMARINDIKSKRFYYCHRSYGYRKKGSDMREIKSMGTNKIGGVCPSMLDVTILKCDETEKVQVEYWKTHCGHQQEIGRIGLDQESKTKIAAKLKEGVTFQHVIDTIRDPATDNEDYQRLLLLERKDLHNITRDFNIDYATKRHKNDAISVKKCKHIHGCAREFNDVVNDCGNNVHYEASVVEQQMLLEMNATPIIVNKNRKIQSQAELILGLSQNEFDDQDREKIEKKIGEVIAFMNRVGKKQIILKPVANVNSQQKIVPQMRLYSTKKKRKCHNPSIPKPTVSEVNAIVSGLENDNSESINVHSTFDHSYV